MIEERMRTALQRKLPEPPEGFGERNDRLVASLVSAGEKQSASREKHRILIPVIAIAAMFNWLAENRSQGAGTEQPIMMEGKTPALPAVDTGCETITVREAQNDGYGLYLSVVFTPKEKDTLAFNWGINPFEDGPKAAGLVPDDQDQTLAEWAVSHGYRKLVRVALMSMPNPPIPKELKTSDEVAAYLEEQGTPFRRTKEGNIQFSHLSSGPDFEQQNDG